MGAYIERFGYDAYAKQNIETYRSLLYETNSPHVAALSSGLPHERSRRCGRPPQGRTSSCFVTAPTCRASSVSTEASGPFPIQTAIAPPVTAQGIASFASPARST